MSLPLPDEALIAFIALLKADGILEHVADVVTRLRRTPGAWKVMSNDLQESESRKLGGCTTWKVDVNHEGMSGRFRTLGTERTAVVGERKSA